MARYEYLRLKLSNFPDDFIKEYNFKENTTKDVVVNVEVQKGMYGIAAGRFLSQILLEEQLKKHGYEQSKLTPGIWKHKGIPICFTLVVDDFGVKYVVKEHARQLASVLKEHYEISEDWEGKNMSDSPLTGITRNDVSMCLCPGMWTTPSYASSMAHHGERNINHINTQCRRMALVNSFPQIQMAQCYSTKTVKKLCNKYLSLSCTTQEQ